MLIVPDKFVLLATPRTGSRALAKALQEIYPEAKRTFFHPHPDDCAGLIAKCTSATLPFVAVLRNPYDQALSMFYACHQYNDNRSAESFKRAVQEKLPRRVGRPEGFKPFPNEYLNPYSFYPATSKVDLFEYNADLRQVLDSILSKYDPESRNPLNEYVVHEVGVSNVDTTLLTASIRKEIERCYPDDIALWNQNAL